ANGIAARGDVIVGVMENAAWIRQGVLTKLPPLRGDAASVASAVSPDGSVAGGYSQSEQGRFHPILWGITANGGTTRRQLPTPPGFLDAEQEAEIRRTIIEPAVRALAEMGRPYRGTLYPGLMITAAGPRVVEFNCRFGDPETQ
ncbi:MAG: phosphoribosylamine--glycine ligase, partial [Armatimonadota bacterium]